MGLGMGVPIAVRVYCALNACKLSGGAGWYVININHFFGGGGLLYYASK